MKCSPRSLGNRYQLSYALCVLGLAAFGSATKVFASETVHSGSASHAAADTHATPGERTAKTEHGENAAKAEHGAANERGGTTEHAQHKEAQPSVNALEKPGCERLPQKTSEELWDVAQCYFKMALHEKAIDVLKEITRRNPNDLEAFFTASWLIWNDSLSKQGEIEKHLHEQSLEILNRAVELNPTHWQAYVERGDHYYLRLSNFTSAYVEYTKARSLYEGDFARSVKPADVGRKASIEARIARTTEKLNRKGESVEASCRALFFDPDDKGSKERIERLHGSCNRKKVPDPRTEEEKKTDAPSAEAHH